MIFKGLRCVIPTSIRGSIKQKLHQAHTGIESTLRRARDTVYWPGMNKDKKKDYIEQCSICNSYCMKQPKHPLISHDIPEQPGLKIGVHIFTLGNTDYLCIVDYFADLFEVEKLTHKKDAPSDINVLKKYFASHGIPVKLQSDNGPPFSSHAFEQFAALYQFDHVTSSPYHAQSNGKVEYAIKTAKNLIKKSKAQKEDYYLSLLSWRKTPTEGLDSSQAQRHYSRRTRTRTTASKLLRPKVVRNTLQRKKKRKEKQQYYYNKGAQTLPTLHEGQTVRIQPTNTKEKWEKAKVISKVRERSYKVQTEDGHEFQRNRKYLRLSKESLIERSELCFEQLQTAATDDASQPDSSRQNTPNETPDPPVLRRSQRIVKHKTGCHCCD